MVGTDEADTVEVAIDVKVSGQTVVDTGTTEVTIDCEVAGQLVTLDGHWKTV